MSSQSPVFWDNTRTRQLRKHYNKLIETVAREKGKGKVYSSITISWHSTERDIIDVKKKDMKARRIAYCNDDLSFHAPFPPLNTSVSHFSKPLKSDQVISSMVHYTRLRSCCEILCKSIWCRAVPSSLSLCWLSFHQDLCLVTVSIRVLIYRYKREVFVISFEVTCCKYYQSELWL